MDTRGSVTKWIDGLKDDDPDAIAQIWKRYGSQLLRIAQSRLGATRKRVADEEDIAMIAFENFCRGVRAGRFEKMNDRGDLWQVLAMLTIRKAIDHQRREIRRGERGESVFVNPLGDESAQDGILRVSDDELSPDLAVLAIEQCDRLLQSLGDETLQQIARLKMQGFNNEDIAEQIGCVTRTVERKLGVIRSKWEAEYDLAK